MCGAKQNYFYITKCRDWVGWGSDRRTLPNANSLELGDPRLAYGFALATSTLVDTLRRGIYPVLAQWRWRQGELLQLPKKGVVRSYRPFRPLP
jgi:hypothetical protein